MYFMAKQTRTLRLTESQSSTNRLPLQVTVHIVIMGGEQIFHGCTQDDCYADTAYSVVILWRPQW